MKGIILAGGTGSRLRPLTLYMGKQLLPIYDKPMIYYPLSTLISLEILDILIISDQCNLEIIKNLLGDGRDMGLSLSYMVQNAPNGISEAFIIGEDFIGDDDVCLILGDNFFFGDMNSVVQEKLTSEKKATILGIPSPCPHNYGVVVFDQHKNIVTIEEKPSIPKSNYIVPGIYFYKRGVSEYAKKLKPSYRGELEITDLNNMYIDQGELQCIILTNMIWYDMGNPADIHAVATFVKAKQDESGHCIGCIEEAAYQKGWISQREVLAKARMYRNSTYGQYLERLAGE